MGHLTEFCTQLKGDASPLFSRWRHDESQTEFMLIKIGERFRVAVRDTFGSWEDLGIKTLNQLVEMTQVDHHL
jgi:hypothetical protein